MKLFSKAVDYNLILENVLDRKRFSSNVKSLLLSMIYKIEIAYPDYARVKNIDKKKEDFIQYIIQNIDEYFENVKTVEPDSAEASILKKNKVSAITNELEKSVLTYPTESALLYAISDIESKYFYIENYIFKKNFQNLLVEGSNLDVLEVLEDFTGWSWNPKTIFEKDYIANIIYQNLIMIFGLEFIDNCKNSQTTQYDIIKYLRRSYKEYYNNLTIMLYLKLKNKRIDKTIEKNIQELEIFADVEKFLAKNQAQIESFQKKVDKINCILENEKSIKKSLAVRNAKLPDEKKIKTVKTYIKYLQKEKTNLENQILEFKKYNNERKIISCKNKLDLYKEMLNTDKTFEEALIELQLSFIKIFYRSVKGINSKEELISAIYKIRYYRNIFISKNKAIKDCEKLETEMNKVLNKLITLGVKKEYIKMISQDPVLNSKIIILCLDSKSMELEDLKLRLDVSKNLITVEVFENKIFEKKFVVSAANENPEITIKKKRLVKIF